MQRVSWQHHHVVPNQCAVAVFVKLGKVVLEDCLLSLGDLCHAAVVFLTNPAAQIKDFPARIDQEFVVSQEVPTSVFSPLDSRSQRCTGSAPNGSARWRWTGLVPTFSCHPTTGIK